MHVINLTLMLMIKLYSKSNPYANDIKCAKNKQIYQKGNQPKQEDQKAKKRSKMSDQFLSGENVCGKTLLDLVARGSALLAQLQRLHHYIPKIFVNPGPKYGKIIHDFSYFLNMNDIQNQIQNNNQLVELNENIKDTYLPLLQRFFRLFESIYTYYEAVVDFINQIQTGVFMQFSLENMFQYEKGKQLVCEALYLFGVMLLLLDQLIEGPVRERIILCYYRNKGGENISRINEVRQLCRDTKFRVPARRTPEYVKPDNYPEDYFARFKFDKQLIESVIIAIKDDDIYRQMAAYPQAKYRSFALANQSSMIFVLLFFMPEVLNKSKSTMRQIVDKHFYNMWVLPYYLGYIIDLTEWWKPYKAAKLALNNILDIETISEMSLEIAKKLNECYEKCKEYLTEGVMTDEFVTYNLNALMNCLRESNICLRWLMLHRKTTLDKLREIIEKSANSVQILKLMLITAEFESQLKQKCVSLLQAKENIWVQDRDACKDRLKELSDYFGREHSLGKIESDQALKNWFFQMSEAVGGVQFSNSTYASRKIQHFIRALDDIEQYPQINQSIQIRQYLFDLRKDLDHMVKIVNIKKSTITFIDIITDITWSWIVLQDYIKLMQKEIKKDPDIALLLKNTFLKLSSILNTPMLRMFQAESPDIESVSKFYSNELVKIVKDVLQIIPHLVFQNLGRLIEIFTFEMEKQPQKLDKNYLEKYAQFDLRLEIAKHTNEISVLAESILNMESYLLGVVEINPRELLQAGIRKELIRLIAQILEKKISVDSKTPENFQQKLIQLSANLYSFKMSLQDIQDFIHVHGLKMFYQEFQKLIYCYTDIEKGYHIFKEVGFQELNYDQYIPMPRFKYDNCNSFLGFLLNEIIAFTHPKKAVFIQSAFGFYDLEQKKQVLTLKTLNIMYKCIGISGLQGIDYLLSLKIMESLKRLLHEFNKINDDQACQKYLESTFGVLKHIGSFSQKTEQAINNLKKYFKPISTYMTQQLQKIGQYILLRDMICLQLRMLSKVGASRLYLVVENLNSSIIEDMMQKTKEEGELKQDMVLNENILLKILTPFTSNLGMSDPMKKIYVTSKPINHLGLILFTTLAINIPLIDYDKNLKSLVRKNKKQSIQPNYYLMGLLCLLFQFNPSNKLSFFVYISSLIKSTINFIISNKQVSKDPELISDLFTFIRFFEECIKFSRQPIEKYKEIIDLGLLSSLDRDTLKQGYKVF